jgi:hypothetical protein
MQSVATNRRRFGIAALLGILSLAFLVWLGVSGPAHSCGGGPAAPTTAFQLMRSAADIDAIFGLGPSDCRADIVQALRSGVMADLFGFIPVYALFLACTIAAVAGQSKGVAATLAAMLAVTVVGDAIETFSQMQILADVDAGAAWLGQLMRGNGLKSLGFAAVLIGLSFAIWQQRGRVSQVAASALALIGALRIGCFFFEPMRSLGPLTALAAYLLLLFYCGWRYRTAKTSPLR